MKKNMGTKITQRIVTIKSNNNVGGAMRGFYSFIITALYIISVVSLKVYTFIQLGILEMKDYYIFMRTINVTIFVLTIFYVICLAKVITNKQLERKEEIN